MEKQKYIQMIGGRISSAMIAMNITQKKALDLCSAQSVNLSQSQLSKILSGSTTSILQTVQLCEVLGLNLSEVFSTNPNVEVYCHNKASDEPSNIITDARNSVFRAYLGTYHIYFYATQSEDTIHRGIFELKEAPETHECTVSFRFKTGDINEHGDEIEKCYNGKAFYSATMQAIYISVSSEKIGELSYMLFHYDYLTFKKLESRLVAAITVGSGIRRLPTMHKLLLTRTELTDEELNYLCGQLKLNASEILLSENAYRGFLNDPSLPNSFFQYFGSKDTNAEGFLSSVANINYYSFNESLISDSFLSPVDKAKIICLLRKYSVAPRYNKISYKAEEIIYKLLTEGKSFSKDSTT
jgi:hypothetical protein